MEKLELDPLAIFLVTRGNSGERMLFRYPFEAKPVRKWTKSSSDNSHPYFLPLDFLTTECNVDDITMHLADKSLNDKQVTRISSQTLFDLHSQVLASLFSTHPLITTEDRKFELKVDDVRFVGHSLSLDPTEDDKILFSRYWPTKNMPITLSMFNVVFALPASMGYSIVKLYSILARMIAVAIRYEEKRQSHLETEARIILGALEEATDSFAFDLVLERSPLAKQLKKLFHQITDSGEVNIRINRWSEILWCLPQKLHRSLNPHLFFRSESFNECQKQLKSYHATLMLDTLENIKNNLPLDFNTALVKVLEQASPEKSMGTLALDTNLTKEFVLRSALQLLYWGKMRLIFPLCRTNYYVLSPNFDPLSPKFVDDFAEQFRSKSLGEFLEMFQTGIWLEELDPVVSTNEWIRGAISCLLWCLQRHIIVQLHVYIVLIINDEVINYLPSPKEIYRKAKAKHDEDEEQAFQRRMAEFRSGRLRTESGKEKGNKSEFPPVTSIRETTFFGVKTNTTGSPDEILEHFRPEHRQAIMKLPFSGNKEDLGWFARLAPYFNGDYHIEDIRYNSNVPRWRIMMILDKFRDVLQLFELEDSSLTYFQT